MPNRPFDPEERRQQEILSTIRNMTANPAALSDPRAVKAMEQAAVNINAATPEIINYINRVADDFKNKPETRKARKMFRR